MVASMLIGPAASRRSVLAGIEGDQVATDGCDRHALCGALSTCRQWLARPEDRTQLSFECLGTVLLAIGYAAVYWHLNWRRRYSRREISTPIHAAKAADIVRGLHYYGSTTFYFRGAAAGSRPQRHDTRISIVSVVSENLTPSSA